MAKNFLPGTVTAKAAFLGIQRAGDGKVESKRETGVDGRAQLSERASEQNEQNFPWR